MLNSDLIAGDFTTYKSALSLTKVYFMVIVFTTLF